MNKLKGLSELDSAKIILEIFSNDKEDKFNFVSLVSDELDVSTFVAGVLYECISRQDESIMSLIYD